MHRPLNYKKLVEVGFVPTPEPGKFGVNEKFYALPQDIELPEGYKMRPAEEKDCGQIRKILLAFLQKFKIFADFNKKESQHWFARKENVLESYVIEKNGKITDFLSFYCLNTSVLNNDKHKEIEIAYGYYFVSNEIPLAKLAEISLIKAK